MTPERRDLNFNLDPDRICDWHPDGRVTTHFFNSLSLFFPEGERLFINAVRHYREQIQDPELREAVRGFIGQEAMHSREHVEYNALMDRAGLPAEALDAFVGKFLNYLQKKLPPEQLLSATIALEHFTAILAHQLLVNRDRIAGATPGYAELWHWHALEETEHKAVAYDVYEAMIGKGLRAYGLRIYGLLAASAIFWPLVFTFHWRMVRADAQARGARGWWRSFRFLFLSPGALRRIVPDWLAYFKPGFHPWEQDNREFLVEIDALLAQDSVRQAA